MDGMYMGISTRDAAHADKSGRNSSRGREKMGAAASCTASPNAFDTADAASQPVRVSATADPGDARLCESVESGHSSHGHSARIAARLGITSDPVRLDSQAKYAVVGRGEADIYLRLPTRADYNEKIWECDLRDMGSE